LNLANEFSIVETENIIGFHFVYSQMKERNKKKSFLAAPNFYQFYYLHDFLMDEEVRNLFVKDFELQKFFV